MHDREPSTFRAGASTRLTMAALAVLVGLLASGCGGSKTAAADERPNVLWIVWDTVRADHLSLHGHERPTTPFLREWAQSARVFDNCVSAAPTTIPSHGSMFTGRMPTEHGANDRQRVLADENVTIAELLGAGGYQTYLYSANPFVSRDFNFAQGFDTEQHPWDSERNDEALRIVREKISPRDRSTELPGMLRRDDVGNWAIKASGTLARRSLVDWLEQRDTKRPYFAFLNYMEAHRPYIPPEEYRRRIMTPAQLEQSYRTDLSWARLWAYTFGLVEYGDEELETVAATYDAAVLELDALLKELLADLEAGGYLNNTIVIVTSDHGEQFGEHHMLDHQYSLYQPLLRVPLVIHCPKRFPAGRETRPVSTIDLFPTLLELTGVELPAVTSEMAVSLMNPRADRVRVAEYPAAFETAIQTVRKRYPRWDPSPWQRSLRALFEGDSKYIEASDGRHELYDLKQDPRELHNLAETAGAVDEIADVLAEVVARFGAPGDTRTSSSGISPRKMQRLAGLGYIGGGEDDDANTPQSRPMTIPAAPDDE